MSFEIATPPPAWTPGAGGARADPLEGTPYRAVGVLGAGGMGEVLEAEHRALNKRVVVKLLREELAGDPRFADRMRVEAQALSAVSSPHVVAVTDLGRTTTGRPYLVMERLHGRTLREELGAWGGVLPVAEAIGITSQVLAGLAAAHRVGLVHRDIKLDNVFVCAPDERGVVLVKVLDFGIAKVLRTGASPPRLGGPRYPTEEGTLVGSPRTSSPEQARFQPVDARTDVYAVGLLLYVLLTGRGPFDDAEDVLDLLNAHIRATPAPPSHHAPGPLPPGLDLAVLRALAKRKEHRFQSAELFAEELGRIAATLGPAPAARARGSGAPVGVGFAPTTLATTGHGTVPMPEPQGALAAITRREPLGEVAAWFAVAPEEAPMAELPVNLAPTAPARPAQGGAGVFVLLTLASAAVFSVLSALLIHYLEAG